MCEKEVPKAVKMYQMKLNEEKNVEKLPRSSKEA